MRLLELPEAMRDFGVDVVEMAGWQSRGIAFPSAPIGGIDHWTVGAATGELPSGAVLMYGRGEPNPLAGPLCNVARGRRVLGRRPRAFMIASGKANHAGRGEWRTSSGQIADSNYDLVGLEVEYRPWTEPLRDEDLEVDAAIHAAAAQVCGYTSADVAGHWEYARPLGRKVDRKPVGGPRLRQLVHHAITKRGDDMAITREDARLIADEVWTRTLVREGVGMNAPAVLVVGDIFHHARLAAAAKPGSAADLDEAAIAREILTHLDPSAIAAAIPDDLAEQVADVLAERLRA